MTRMMLLSRTGDDTLKERLCLKVRAAGYSGSRRV